MGEVNTVLREERIEFEGKTYLMPRLSFDSEKIWETQLEDKALEKTTARRFKIGEEAFRVALSVWQKDCAANEYGWLGQTSEKAWRNEEGFRRLIFILLNQGNPQGAGGLTIDMPLVNRMVEAKGNEIMEKWIRLLMPTPTTPPAEGSGANS